MNQVDLRFLLADRELTTPASKIVRTLSARGSMSAAQLSRVTGLAKSTVSTTLAELRRIDMVVESGTELDGSVGRPATTLMLNPEAGTCVGILIGQCELQVIIADVSHRVLADKSVVVEQGYSPATALKLIRKLVAEAYAGQWQPEAGLIGVGLAVGSPVNPHTGQVMRGGLPAWTGVNLHELFAPMFDAPIFADNESNCLAIAEMTWGAARGHEDFIVYTLDLGVGGAIVTGGRVLRGIAGGAGEFGHVVIDPDGPLCRCGNRGCLEVYASFRNALAVAERHAGRPLLISDVVEMARAGDETCLRLIREAGEAGGRGLGLISSVFNPPLVIVNGRLAAAGELLMAPLTESFERFSLIKSGDVPEHARTVLRAGAFSSNGACMGAVGMVLRNHGEPLNLPH